MGSRLALYCCVRLRGLGFDGLVELAVPKSLHHFTQGENAPRKKPLMHCERDVIGRRRKDSQQEKCKIDLTDKRRKATRVIMIHME